MARDKSAIAVVVVFLTLGVGALVGWIARGATNTTPSDRAITAVQAPETSILLPRSATGDDADAGADGVQAEAGTAETGSDTATAAETVTTMSAGEQSPTTSGASPVTAAPSDDSPSDDSPSDDSASEDSSTGPTTEAPATTAQAGVPTTSATTTTTGAPTTIAPATTAPTTTVLVLTDPSFNSVQFQSPIACTGGAAVAKITWDTIDASTVAILINGQSIATDLPPGGAFDANFACDADGVHDVELIATGISSDPTRAAFTSSVTDQITTEG